MREVIQFPELRALPAEHSQLGQKEPSGPKFALVLGSGGVRSTAALGMLDQVPQLVAA
jgi:hypothetical protein